MSDTILIHPPGSSHPSLADGPTGFDRKWLMGKWGVTWSTLPMWKDKKDVVITYDPVAAETRIDTTFDSTVEYRKTSAAANSKPSTVRGSETLSTGANGATFDWRGKSYLFFVTSHWEILGYGKDDSNGLDWAVTFFSKTLFTPAGIDIYIRASPSATVPASTEARIALRDKLVSLLKNNEDQGVVKLADGGFEVPGTV
ncbi:hypothetical protein BCR39DRAFT_518005 [Naematelia encephala]|uniref:Uncharacterized protein n=1 Tax=Naematelia encephala TaxID=71784 RepID=A0A1Y2BGQ1_9TREE|nr:hypothetical protein BCR39DRAFT_518005 [Naematelia encephala]